MPDSSSPLPDLDLRLVRYFTAVAEHQNFSRAADALHLAQPSLSRQIQHLERVVGARLLERTPRGSRLTAAGEAFLLQAQELLRSADRATAHARAAAEPTTLTVGYIGNLSVTPAVLELRRRHPEADVRTEYLLWHEPHAALLDHRVDVALARPPFPDDTLDVTVLYEEPRVLVVPVGHRLAGRASVTLADFADEPLVRFSEARWDAFWRIDPRPDGRPAPDGPLVEETMQRFELVASGQALSIAPPGAPSTWFREDLTSVPIAGIAPTQVVIATRPGDRVPRVREFRDIAVHRLTARRTPPP
ncbi:LysR family transcriptional regulator [Blastococcus xanthinilyticus]|uniref:DNA-binding transcriptional LysR family regulator n=1 Tax=Blastococcus xanthinilyticus TaxID=1564164 RepID=A0A5S5D5E7_9ACTN|nr:LysR family transcriptional regulator [Blastococcus xanthinilyticus]TYP90518.1 DNA-binding transcriptional LysR family regulator [Blastococcus xanthinilyticus]